MATFSTNQVKHLYVAKALNNSLTTVGDITFAAAGDGQIVAKYKGNDGVVRTDLIDLCTLQYKLVKSYTEYPESVTVTMGSSMAIPGQQYILKVTVNEFGGMTYEDKGFIFGEYTAVADDANKNVLANLASNLAKNAAKAAYNPLIKVYLVYDNSGSNAYTEVTAATAVSSLTGTYTGIVIEGAEQPWVPGKMGSDKVLFDVATDKIIKQGLETAWATIAKNTVHVASAIVNSKKIADLEAFCFGERGDIYRGAGWPNNFEFKPVANASETYGYHLLDLTWAYQGDAEDIQKSPKELIIAVPANGLTTYTTINGMIGAATSSAANYTINKAIKTVNDAQGTTFPYIKNFA